MQKINILDHSTIDKIAAGEVVERPASVVKELTENSMDAGAHIITVEIKGGGISLIRVTDDGCGIDRSQLENAFMRHATSKISRAEDLTDVVTMGFRGEAIASIAAVSRTEMISKVPEDMTGMSYTVEGGVHTGSEEVGAPDGTTVIVRDLFYNTLPRRKFLRKEQTEASYVADLMERLALSRPDISFKYIQNNMLKFQTSGDGDLREIIYRIYGRDLSQHILPVRFCDEELKLTVFGYIGDPAYSRASRDLESFFVNNRSIESKLISRAVEEGYLGFLMQHKFPVAVLHIAIDTSMVDVNVHPSKREIRLSHQNEIFDFISKSIHDKLSGTEEVPDVSLEEGHRQDDRPPELPKRDIAESYEKNLAMESAMGSVQTVNERGPLPDEDLFDDVNDEENSTSDESAESHESPEDHVKKMPSYDVESHYAVTTPAVPEQMTLDLISHEQEQEENGRRIISAEARRDYRVIGQVFETYWLIAYEDRMLIMDQHAAHEKVKFEHLMKQYEKGEVASQMLDPPYIITLTPAQADRLNVCMQSFKQLGFVIEQFGGNEYAMRSVPLELYGASPQVLLDEILEDLRSGSIKEAPDSVRSRIATMACKAAVKGNNRLSQAEAEALLDELMSLKDPYHCPHGRPTMITMSKYELDRKFKRITD
jgi:DNA mismatch repair protein MutL